MTNPDLLLAFDSPNSATAGQFTHGGLRTQVAAGYNTSTPDSVPLSCTGDMELIAYVKYTNNGGTQTVHCKWVGVSQQAYVTRMTSSNQMEINWGSVGTDNFNLTSTAGIGNTFTGWLRWSFKVNDGGQRSLTCYTSTDPFSRSNNPLTDVAWSALEAKKTTSAGSAFVADTTAPFIIGEQQTTQQWADTLYRVLVYNVTTIVFDADFTALPVGTTSFIESSSNHATVTVNGPVAADSSGNLRDGRAVNGVTFGSAGKKGLAATFDGVNDYVRVPNWGLGTTLTVAAWINPTSITAVTQTIECMSVGSGNGGHALYLAATSGKLTGAMYDGTSGVSVASNAAIVAGVWTHVALTVDATNINLYINGVLDRSFAKGTPTTSALDVTIGAFNANSPNSFFGGLIDDLRVYPTALSQSDIQSLMSLTSRSPSRPLSRPLTRTTPIS